MTRFRIFPHSGDSVEPQDPSRIVYTWSDGERGSDRYFYSEIEASTDYLAVILAESLGAQKENNEITQGTQAPDAGANEGVADDSIDEEEALDQE